MGHVVMTKNLFLTARLTDAFDHRIVIQCVRKDKAVRHQLGNGGNASLVRDIARGENEGGIFVMQISKLALKFD